MADSSGGRREGSETQVLPQPRRKWNGDPQGRTTPGPLVSELGPGFDPSLICAGSRDPHPNLDSPAPTLLLALTLTPTRGLQGQGWGLTLSTNVLSFSGISRGMVVRTSMMADRGMLDLGLEA